MKTIEKKYYVCEICGKTGQDEEKILACQESHKDLNPAVVECTYAKGKVLPKTATFVFPDGSKAEYFYNFSTDTNGKPSKYEA